MFKRGKSKKLTSLLVTLMMLVSFILPVPALVVSAIPSSKTIHLVGITDFHGTLYDSSNNQVGAVLVDSIKKVEAANPNSTLILGSGDLYQGSALSNINKGLPVQKVFSDMGLDITAVGNHEFDWGLDTILNTTMVGATYSMVCANIYNKTTSNRVFTPYNIVVKDGVRIAVIGAITNESPSIIMPSFISNYEFKDMATEVNLVAKDIKDNNLADVIVLLAHEGETALETVVSNLHNVDVVFGGHSHKDKDTTVADKDGKNIPVLAANYNGKGYIDLTMTINPDKTFSFSTGNYKALDNASGYKTTTPIVDATAKSLIDAAKAAIAPIVDELIGTNASNITRTQITNGNGLFGESYLGNWASDVVRLSANADIGLSNNGGLRCDIPAGNLTVGSMWQFMPFDNVIYKVSMNKAQLKAILEQAVMDRGKGIQISGIKFSYSPSKPSGSRIYNIVRENGKAILDSETLTVATNDFLATGGDGFTAFSAVNGGNPSNNTFILVRDALY